MPKIVDREARRTEIVRAVWSLIARRGLTGVTMRELAAEAGFANGALAPYFRGKDEILRAAYRHAVDATNTRAAQRITDATGLTALRLLCLEIMPLDEERILEARVAVAFWDQAAHDEHLSTVHADAMAEWHSRICGYLLEARDAGEIVDGSDLCETADTLLSALMGMQINAILAPKLTSPDRQIAVLDGLLAQFAR